MVFFNYALRKLNAKIVYYGPGLCGKTTNLQWIHDHFEGGHRGKMISLATEGDRTIFFDLLPLDIGTIRGMDVTLQLYTVPGQVHYNSTRQLVLKGADGVVFVADSQRAMHSSNVGSWENLKENLLLQGVDLATFPHVLQFNKRDLRDIMSIEEMDSQLNEFDAPIFESVATEGIGVQESLEGIVKLVMRSLRDRYEPVASQGPIPAGGVTPPGGGPRPPAPVAAFRAPAPPVSAPPPGPPPGATPEAGLGDDVDEEAVTHPTIDAVRGDRDSGPDPGEPETPAAAAGPVEPSPVEEQPATPDSENETTMTIEPPVEAEQAPEPAVADAGDEGFIPPMDSPGTTDEVPGTGDTSSPGSAPAWEDADVASGPADGEPGPEPTTDGAEEPFGGNDGAGAVEAFAGDESPGEESAAGPFTAPPMEAEESAPQKPAPEQPGEEPGASVRPVAASVDDLVASVVDGTSLPSPPRVEPVVPPVAGEAEAEEPGAAVPADDAGGAAPEPGTGPGEHAGEPSSVEQPTEPETVEAPEEPRPWESAEVSTGEECGAFPTRDPFVLDPEEPFAAPGEAEAPVAAEASAVVAVPVTLDGGDAAGGAGPPNQLQVQLEGTRALARSGDVRELDILVPVPGAWIGNRRVTLQLRLTLVPASEEES